MLYPCVNMFIDAVSIAVCRGVKTLEFAGMKEAVYERSDALAKRRITLKRIPSPSLAMALKS